MKVAVLGTGSWGTALAQVLSDNGCDVLMYGVVHEEISDINENHRNSVYFGDIEINNNIRATLDIKEAVYNAYAVVLAVPSRAIKTVLLAAEPHLPQGVIIINVAKGFDPDSGMRISSLIRASLPDSLDAKVVSAVGPSHAEEVIERKITSICAVSQDKEAAEKVQRLLSNDYLRLYANSDEIGAEYGAAYKNVIALAAGILDGQRCGDNAKAALVTRGLAEMVRYGAAKGAKRETYEGLTGIGDLVVTCFSSHSRNHTAGYAIGEADSAKEFLLNNKKTVEGIYSCKSICLDARKNHPELSLPITFALYDVLYCEKKPSIMIAELMQRPLKSE